MVGPSVTKMSDYHFFSVLRTPFNTTEETCCGNVNSKKNENIKLVPEYFRLRKLLTS
jgi:hypothetical protein